MQLTYKLYKDFKKPFTTQSEKIAYGSYLLGLLVCIGSLTEMISYNYGIVALISLIIGGIVLWSTFFLEEEHSKTLIGNIIFEEDEITFENVKISWGEIKVIHLSYFDIKGTWGNNSKYQKQISSGIDNVVYLLLNDGRLYNGHFLLENKIQSKVLLELLWRVVKSKKLSLENSKQVIHPIFYKDIQELKQILVK
jgi:hypothetical protein